MFSYFSHVLSFYILVRTLLFIDDVADHLRLPNTTVIVLERDQGLMDVLRWIESQRYNVAEYNIIGLMVGRADAVRSLDWFIASVSEVIQGIVKRNPKALQLWGAVIPSPLDDRVMVRKFVDKNAALQKRCLNGTDRKRLEYTRSGKVLLTKGGPIQEFYGKDHRLNQIGLKKLAMAITRKFGTAGLVKRAQELHSMVVRMTGLRRS